MTIPSAIIPTSLIICKGILRVLELSKNNTFHNLKHRCVEQEHGQSFRNIIQSSILLEDRFAIDCEYQKMDS